MRTTVTLDPDVERLLREKARQSRQSFKQVLNNAIRHGLKDESKPSSAKSFRVKARAMRLQEDVDPTQIGHLSDDFEIKAFLELSNRLSKHKRPR